MKRYIIIALAALALASCSDKGQEGAGDATIGFAQTEYTYKESAGLVKIPVKFTGEPKHYPITFDVEVSLAGGETLEDVIHFTQSKGLKYAGNELAPAYIEFQVHDNKVINEDVVMTFSLENISGATPAGATAQVIIADNDNNPYDRLWGDWILHGIDEDGIENSFEVSISGGFTEEEQKKNDEKVLVCWGWAGVQYDLRDQDFELEMQPVWYINYDAEVGGLSVQTNTLMATSWEFTGVDELCNLYMLTVTPGWSLDENIELKGFWNEDMTIITFEGDYGLAARVKGATTGESHGYWYGFTDITMTRKPE